MGKFEAAGLVLWVRWECEVPALRLMFLRRRGPRALVTGRDYGLGLVPAEALTKAQTVAAASPLSSGIQSRGKAFGLIYDSSRYCPSLKRACGKCVICARHITQKEEHA